MSNLSNNEVNAAILSEKDDDSIIITGINVTLNKNLSFKLSLKEAKNLESKLEEKLWDIDEAVKSGMATIKCKEIMKITHAPDVSSNVCSYCNGEADAYDVLNEKYYCYKTFCVDMATSRVRHQYWNLAKSTYLNVTGENLSVDDYIEILAILKKINDESGSFSFGRERFESETKLKKKRMIYDVVFKNKPISALWYTHNGVWVIVSFFSTSELNNIGRSLSCPHFSYFRTLEDKRYKCGDCSNYCCSKFLFTHDKCLVCGSSINNKAYKKAYEHTRRRISERYSILIDTNDYVSMLNQINSDNLETIANVRHPVINTRSHPSMEPSYGHLIEVKGANIACAYIPTSKKYVIGIIKTALPESTINKWLKKNINNS